MLLVDYDRKENQKGRESIRSNDFALDRFGRIVDLKWKQSSNDLVQLKYGYDRDSNRTYRLDEVATANSKHFDELYGYDGLNRLTSFDRGQLDANGDNLTNATLGQTWDLDPTGNWDEFEQTVAGAFKTTRTHNEVNEIETISTPSGSPVWDSPPVYDANGNMTEFVQPKSLGNSYDATYDAWNRLVALKDGSDFVNKMEYDGLNRRITRETFTSGSSDETRHFYYSDQWQVLEERVDASTDADRQFVWGTRYVDDLVLRDKGSERLYSLQDALFNVVALTDDTGAVKERFAYQPYGVSEELNPDFATYTGTDYNWEYRFTGRELDLDTGLQLNRNRYYHNQLGRWLTRDLGVANSRFGRTEFEPLDQYRDGPNLYQYVRGNPGRFLDPNGTAIILANPRDPCYPSAQIDKRGGCWLPGIPTPVISINLFKGKCRVQFGYTTWDKNTIGGCYGACPGINRTKGFCQKCCDQCFTAHRRLANNIAAGAGIRACYVLCDRSGLPD